MGQPKIYIETERLILRDWKKDDEKDFARINSDPLVMEYLPRVLDEKASNHLVQKFKAHFKKHGYGLFAVEHKDTGEFMGFVGLNHVDFKAAFTPAVEIAWRLDYPYWGQGYASEAARAVLDYAFKELELEEVVSFTVHDNDRSMGVMENIGLSRDVKGDFLYPKLPADHPLAEQRLFRITAKAYKAQAPKG